MLKRVWHVATAAILGVVLHGVAYSESRTWEIVQAYSTDSGAVQFIELYFAGDCGAALPALPVLADQTLIASDGNAAHRFTFASNANNYSDGWDVSIGGPFCGRLSTVLIATQGFADLHIVEPDFVVPNGFLFLPSGLVRLGVSEFRYDKVPAGSPSMGAVRAQAMNNAFEYYEFVKFNGMPEGVNPVIEYYNAGLDDYFLTAYATEIQSLDSASPAVWQRTGYSLPAWTSTFSANAVPPASLASACRYWLGNSHFYSISPDECYLSSRLRGAILETQAAFLATLPNINTGVCLSNQASVYRLWNPNGSAHRFTTEAVVRDEMLARGWIAEGYGPDNVAMCVGGTR